MDNKNFMVVLYGKHIKGKCNLLHEPSVKYKTKKEAVRTRGKNWHNAYELNDCELGRSSNNLENAAACIFIGH